MAKKMLSSRLREYNAFMPENTRINNSRLFYTFLHAPASKKYHGAYEGGLFDHSLAVAQDLLRLTEKLNLTWQRPESPYIVGMYHDFCKTDDYTIDPTDWGYINNPKSIINGHGDKSIILLYQETDLKLTPEEIACIRWHMGAYEHDPELWGYYNRAVKRYPNVLYTHVADMAVSHIKNV